MKPTAPKAMAKAPPAPKTPSPLDIMNTLGNVADMKSRMNVQPEDEEDSLNSDAPKPNGMKSPASVKGKQVAALKEQEKGKGKMIPNQNNV